MPFYEYQCTACGHHHEELQKVGDPALRKCPACGRGTLRRLVSAPVFRLKGGGWYETDFKAGQEAKRNLAGEKEPAPDSATAAKADKADKAEKPDGVQPAAQEAPQKIDESPAAAARKLRRTARRAPASRPRRR